MKGTSTHVLNVESRVAGVESARTRHRNVPLFFLGTLLVLTGLIIYFFGIVFSIFRLALHVSEPYRTWNQAVIWYSGVPTTFGVLLAAADLAFLLPSKRKRGRREALEPISNRQVVVALTAYNDEQSIAAAVADFRDHPSVRRVIVVDNNSRDNTFEVARGAGAVVVKETEPGYGRCVYRCLQEALADRTADLIVLCEGDMTFRAKDLEKLLAYIDHADVVNGTRIVEQLRDYTTQLTTFMYYGNFFVGKLLEMKHLGRGTFTDVGTTYKLLRRRSLERLLPILNPAVNLEFNAHFLDMALDSGEKVVECPITFHPRVGLSKGGNTNNLRALRVGIRMIMGLCFGWRSAGR
ncbi:MAG: glycosyltransferase family 2 protein [Acidobacteriaceae bacterium]|nr:glycosyltransferase family 2 protein [Acidobacteriaceae bacterium]